MLVVQTMDRGHIDNWRLTYLYRECMELLESKMHVTELCLYKEILGRSYFYLINRISSSFALEFKTRQEIWTGKPLSYSHFRVFGCATYACTKQDKLEARASKCIVLGYPEGVK